MQINLAKTAGFCFGVNRAVDLVYSMLAEGKKVCTLGPLIHNPQVIADLESKGTRIIDKPSQFHISVPPYFTSVTCSR